MHSQQKINLPFHRIIAYLLNDIRKTALKIFYLLVHDLGVS